MSEEKEYEFEWRCPRCKQSGFVADPKLWKYCPYCGAEIEVKLEE